MMGQKKTDWFYDYMGRHLQKDRNFKRRFSSCVKTRFKEARTYRPYYRPYSFTAWVRGNAPNLTVILK